MAENIPNAWLHHGSKCTQYQIIITQFVTDPVTVSVLLSRGIAHVPCRATCLAQPRFEFYRATAGHARWWSGAWCTAFPKPSLGWEGPVNGNSQGQHLYFSPVKGQGTTKVLHTGVSTTQWALQENKILVSCRRSKPCPTWGRRRGMCPLLVLQSTCPLDSRQPPREITWGSGQVLREEEARPLLWNPTGLWSKTFREYHDTTSCYQCQTVPLLPRAPAHRN